MTINAQQAVEAAVNYYTAITNESRKLSIEEVDIQETGVETYWLITIGISDQFGVSIGNTRNKEYKIFKIDKEDGEVLSMKIREVK